MTTKLHKPVERVQFVVFAKIQHTYWMSTRELIPNSEKSQNCEQKAEIECRKFKFNWLTGKSRKHNKTKWWLGEEIYSNNVLIQSLREEANNKNT